ncbi:L-lactate permease [Falsiroseomonas selenitidurans]|uniref:L-lactate permease n=1 Tax=Falsiroseomonas selenitidurans TaxID=2716335 RepID=A0ABX1E745_9PROT|nr:L-lactate permease [Falsiroseomonas selenitidurans]NKC32550.1 L-lactate permease [Falsiroseomonas selenitidurans]
MEVAPGVVLAALLPVGLIVLLMAGLGRRASVAGLAGLVVALPVALLGFGWPAPGRALGALAGVAAEAGFTTLTILWIVAPALCLHEWQQANGGAAVLRQGLLGLSADRRVTALLVAWFFALFAEGAAGFGTPVVLAAPILVGLGFPPAQAVAMALLGHAVGVSFGAVGTPVLPQLAASGLDPRELAGATALLHAAGGWIMALALHRVTGSGGLRLALGAALAFLLPFTAIAMLVGPELPTLGGALLGGLVFVLALPRAAPPAAAAPDRRALLLAALPYLLLLGLILATRLVPPLRQALEGVTIAWSLAGGAFQGQVAPLYHPGTLLLASLLLAAAIRWRAGHQGASAGAAALRRAAGRALAGLPPVLLALLLMLGLARLMVHAGMIDALALAAAALAGAAWPGFAAAVGVLGTFVTGSATASNILLTDFQLAAAAALSLPALPLLAAQGVGAAIGNVICPHNIVAGGASVGLAGQEGRVLRATLPAALASAALAGALTLAALAIRPG